MTKIDPAHVIMLRASLWKCRGAYLTNMGTEPVAAKLRGFRGISRFVAEYADLARLPMGLILLALGK